MILFYRNLFYLIYRLFKRIEGGYAHQTDWNRALEVVFVISLFEMLNVLSFLPATQNNEGGELWVPYILLLLLNAAVFLALGRFNKIESQFLRKPPSIINDSFVVLYLIGTILVFALTR